MSTKTIDQQFIEYVVQSLVSKPEAVVVERIIDEKGVLLTLTVDPEDLGRVIGKRGATAQSLRTLLRALGTKQEARFNLKIVDNGVPKPERTREESSNNTEAENDSWTSSVSDDDDTSAAADAANDSGEEESAASRTRKELADLDDLDI